MLNQVIMKSHNDNPLQRLRAQYTAVIVGSVSGGKVVEMEVRSGDGEERHCI